MFVKKYVDGAMSLAINAGYIPTPNTNGKKNRKSNQDWGNGETSPESQKLFILH